MSSDETCVKVFSGSEENKVCFNHDPRGRDREQIST